MDVDVGMDVGMSVGVGMGVGVSAARGDIQAAPSTQWD